jgi:hypothetical protein
MFDIRYENIKPTWVLKLSLVQMDILQHCNSIHHSPWRKMSTSFAFLAYTVAPLVASLCTLTYIVISTQIAWVHAFIKVGANPFFSLNIPVDIGLLKCLSEICENYKSFERQFHYTPDPSNNPFPWAPPIPSAISGGDGGSTSGVTASGHHDSMFGGNVEGPFHDASVICAVFLVIAVLCSLVTLFTVTVALFNEDSLALKAKRLSMFMWVTAVSLLLGSVLYMLMTYNHLNGGRYYVGGIYMLNFMSLLNAMCAIACSLDATPDGYSRIYDRNINDLDIEMHHKGPYDRVVRQHVDH